jgi:hypothetical protein
MPTPQLRGSRHVPVLALFVDSRIGRRATTSTGGITRKRTGLGELSLAKSKARYDPAFCTLRTGYPELGPYQSPPMIVWNLLQGRTAVGTPSRLTGPAGPRVSTPSMCYWRSGETRDRPVVEGMGRVPRVISCTQTPLEGPQPAAPVTCAYRSTVASYV